MNKEELIKFAEKALEKAYAPYSNYHVGAALLTKSGKVYTGCNIENHGIMSICAERVAFLKAISEGEREFNCIAVMAKNSKGVIESTRPCGYCRQFMSEFVDKDFKIYTKDNNEIKEYTMEELLPENFSL